MRLNSAVLLLLALLVTVFGSAASVNTTKQVDIPLPMSQLLPDKRAKASTTLEGHIRLSPKPEMARLSQAQDHAMLDDPRKVLPTIVFDFVQGNNGEIIPLQRSLRLSNNPYWDYFVGVGDIWQSSSDSNIHQITLPFTLVEKNENCVHNGVLTFSLDQQQRADDFYYQISSETCAYFKADFWGWGSTELVLENISTAKQVVEEYQTHLKQHLPIRPIQQLRLVAPDISLDALALKPVVEPADMTLYGLVFNQIHYVSDCFTRSGNYPYCEQLVLPSYSTAKSIFAGLSMFYLQQRFGDVFEQPLNKWITQCRGAQWQGVTFAHLLDMASGNYDSAQYGIDEGADAKLDFFNAKDHVSRIDFACDHYSRKRAPGSQFVYHSSDTYLLGTALNNYLKNKLGDQTDLFEDVLLKQIFKPLNLSQISYASRRTNDTVRQVYSGYGLFFTRDDIARLTIFISQQASATGEAIILAQTPLRAGLQLSRTSSGLSTDYSTIRYLHSFWAKNINSLLQCQQDSWLPFMSGFGGITVAILPKHNSYYYFSDSHQYNWSSALAQLAKLQSLCASHPARPFNAAPQEKLNVE